jgi:uncharacterized protein YndB with AHSA1/START domain
MSTEPIVAKPVVIERTVNAPASMVWRAITDRDQLKEWYFDLEEFKPEVGFEFHFFGGPADRSYKHLCKITEVITNQKLTYSWRYDGYEGHSFVSFELIAVGEKTTLRLTHAGLETFPKIPDFAPKNFVEGWTEIIGSSLKNYLEKPRSAGREIFGSRVLNAPRELVWKVFTEPVHMKEWWGPIGFTNTIHKMDVRPGGEWNFTMHGPDGTDYRNESHFAEVVKPERIVFVHGPTPCFQTIIELSDQGSKTELRWRNIFDTDEDFKRAIEVFRAVEGLQQTFARLAEYVTAN